MVRFLIRFFVSGVFLGLVVSTFTGCSDPEAKFSEDIARADELIDEGRYDSAINILNRLNEEFPERAIVLNEMGRVYEAQGEDFFAGIYFEQAGRLDPEFSESLLVAARYFESEGDTERALEVVDDYLEQYPDDAEAWRFSANMLADSRRLQSALSAHLRAERLDGPARNPEYAASMGELYLEAGNVAQAEVHFETALEEAPADRFRALMGLLATSYGEENFARSEEIIGLLEEEFPGAVESSALAIAQEQVQLWRLQQETLAQEIAALEAQRAADEAAAAEAEMSEEEEATEEAGSTAEVAGQPGGKFAGLDVSQAADEEAMEEEEVEIELPPPPPPPEPTTYELAIAAREGGNFDRAVPLFWKAVQEDPDDAELWAELSKTYLMEGDPENAEIAILEALRREPSSLQYTLTYLNVVQQSRSQARFMEELESAYNRIPNSPDIVLAMARAYAQPGGNPSNASYFYREFLEMAPNHPEVVAARRELNALP